MSIHITSEINPLKKVIIHSPGREIESMTPETAESELYNDIIPLGIVAEEHKQLADFLSLVSQVLRIKDLFIETLSEENTRMSLLSELERRYSLEGRSAELAELTPPELAEICISGLKKKSDTLSKYLSKKEFDLLPLPNLFFTRDSSMAYRQSIITGAMARPVRSLESLIMYYIFSYHPQFRDTQILYNGAAEADTGVSIEGGDFLVLREDLLVIGLSERTNSSAVDLLMKRIAHLNKQPFTVFIVPLPKSRATIHLDMICTQIDENLLLTFDPMITGPRKREIVRVDVSSDGTMEFSRVNGLLPALSDAGMAMETVSCGGNDPLKQKREQWLSGANMFTFAPGKIIGYSCNTETFDALAARGFTVRKAKDFITGKEKVSDHKRLAVQIEGVELARGGGGIRCMTMPLERR